MLNRAVVINPINSFYNSVDTFREQVAVLYSGGVENNQIKAIRSWVNICGSGCAGFDVNSPTEDTQEGWRWIDQKIEEEGVIGIFHTHPPGLSYFSEQDNNMQVGFAQTYGKKFLWHGVQSVDQDVALIKCFHMPEAPRVACYDFGHILSSLDDAVILLPLPYLKE